jgi:hypothetical protein
MLQRPQPSQPEEYPLDILGGIHVLVMLAMVIVVILAIVVLFSSLILSNL